MSVNVSVQCAVLQLCWPLLLNVNTAGKPAVSQLRNVISLKASISTVWIMLFHSKLLKGKAVLAAKNYQVHTQKIVDTGVRICTAGQLHLVMFK